MTTSNYKLITALRTLSLEEWKDFEKHLLTTITKSSDSYRVFTLLARRKNNLPDKNNLDTLRSKSIPTLNKKGLLNIMSKLYQYLEEYLKTNAALKNSSLTEQLLIAELNRRGMYELATKKYHILEEFLINDGKSSTESYQILRQLYHCMYYSDNPIKKSEGTVLLKKLCEVTITGSSLSASQYRAELINWGRIDNVEFKDEILSLRPLIEKSIENSPQNTLNHLNTLIENYDAQALYALEAMLDKGEINTTSELHTLVTIYGIIYGIKLWQTGTIKSTDTIIRFYEEAFTHNKFGTNGKIPPERFFTALSTIGMSKSIEWCYNFIATWIARVESNNIDGIEQLSKAIVAFYHKDYKSIMIHLRTANITELSAKLRAHALQAIGSYYNYTDSPSFFDSTITNYKLALRRNKTKMSKNTFDSNCNFIAAIQALIGTKYKSITTPTNISNKPLVMRLWVYQELKMEMDKKPISI